MPDSERRESSLLALSALVLIVSGPSILLLQTVNGFIIMWASGVTSLGIATFMHLFLGGLENGSLDFDVESNSLLKVLSKLAMKGRFAAAPAFFIFSWLLLSGGYFLYDHINSKTAGLDKRTPAKNVFDIDPALTNNDPSSDTNVEFQVKYNDSKIGRFLQSEAIRELRRLASDTAGTEGKGNSLTKRLLRDCAYNRDTCLQPDLESVKVSFYDRVGPGNAFACPKSQILAIAKMRPGNRVLSKTSGVPDTPVKIASILPFPGYSPVCQKYQNLLQIDSRYIPQFDPAVGEYGLTDGFLMTPTE